MTKQSGRNNECINLGKYQEIEDNILKKLEYFQSFLYFKDTLCYKQILPSRHQQEFFFASAKYWTKEGMLP